MMRKDGGGGRRAPREALEELEKAWRWMRKGGNRVQDEGGRIGRVKGVKDWRMGGFYRRLEIRQAKRP